MCQRKTHSECTEGINTFGVFSQLEHPLVDFSRALSAFAENPERSRRDEREEFSASADFAPAKRVEKILLALASGASYTNFIMDDCVFCKVVAGEMGTKFDKETPNLVVFKDINPQAAVHLLIVPKTHVKDLSELDDKIWQEIKDVSVALSREKSMKGFRLVHNAGDAAAVGHMHIHFLGDVSPERAV